MATQPVIKIEKNVLPPNGRDKHSLFPWREAEPGDSFFVPTELLPVGGQGGLSARAASYWGRGNYRTAKVDGGVRVWRLA